MENYRIGRFSGKIMLDGLVGVQGVNLALTLFLCFQARIFGCRFAAEMEYFLDGLHDVY